MPPFYFSVSTGRRTINSLFKLFSFFLFNILRKKGKRALGETICIHQGAYTAAELGSGEEECSGLMRLALGFLHMVPKRSQGLK